MENKNTVHYSVPKKALSVFLACLMVLTAVAVGLVPLDLLKANAATYDVVIGVPETIYMTPQSNYSTTTTSVKYYVNNTVSSSGAMTLDTSNAATAGEFYIYGTDIDSVAGISVDGAALSGCEPTKSGNLISDTSFSMSLNSGISSSQTKTLEWAIKCNM